ncbi:MAG: acyl-ACP--UDP-N-acetylglucosamine O-acyltransferase [Gammaproteobacteria bacterium]
MIDPRAIVDPAARLAPGVSVGPFSVIGPDVEIGAGTAIGPHAVVKGPTRIGRNNRIYQFASIGEDPQDKKYAGEATRLEIGDGNLFREYVTVHRGTVQGGGITRIGDDNWIMISCHIAHDCIIGSHTIFSNNAALAGHVTVQDYAILGGYTLVHQFCAIGAHCFTAMGSVISKDVPPYVLVSGHMAKPHGLNVEGLKRRGFSSETLAELRRAYKLLYKSGLTLEQALGEIRALAQTTPEAGALVAFIEASTRGVIR